MIRVSSVLLAFSVVFVIMGLLTSYGGFYIAALFAIISVVGLDRISGEE